MDQKVPLLDLALECLVGAVRVPNGDHAGQVVRAQLAALVLADEDGTVDVVVHVAVNEVNPAVLCDQCAGRRPIRYSMTSVTTARPGTR